MLGNKGSRTCGIFCLYSFQVGMIGEESATLHQCHRMGMNLLKCTPVIIGQTADAVLYMESVLAYYCRSTLAQKLIVVEQTARYGILDGYDADDCRIALDVFEHLLEGGATNQFHLFITEILMGSYVMKRPQLALYCYSLHLYCLYLL